MLITRQHKKACEEKDINDIWLNCHVHHIRFPECDVVIEAATENEAVKQKSFVDLPNTEAGSNFVHKYILVLTRLGQTRIGPVGLWECIYEPRPRYEACELIRGIATEEGITVKYTS